MRNLVQISLKKVYDLPMRKKNLVFGALIPFCVNFYAQEISDTITLEDAITLAVENNYSVQQKRFALATAKAQYRQIDGAFDFEVGASASYDMSQNPTDEDDPKYTSVYYGSDNTTSYQTVGSVFVKKLFSFGLDSKLSYSIKRNHDYPNYPESLKYEQEDARNFGYLNLELKLPLFKAFKDSINAMQLESARDKIAQMQADLDDTVAKVFLSVAQNYWKYSILANNLGLLEELQKNIENRKTSVESLVRAGVRTSNDLLAMQVSALENQRKIENARVSLAEAKLNLMTILGIDDSVKNFLPPNNPFFGIDLDIEIPDTKTIDADFIENVLSSRGDTVALKKQIEQAEREVRIAQVDSRPDATLGFSIGTTGTRYSDGAGGFIGSGFSNIRGVNVSGSLSVSAKIGNNAKKGAEDAAQSSYNSLLVEYAQKRNTLELQIKNALEKLSIYRSSVQNAEGTLRLQKDLYDNSQKLFNAGRITVLDLEKYDENYLSAEESYRQTLVSYLTAILEYKYYTATLLGVTDGDLLFPPKKEEKSE